VVRVEVAGQRGERTVGHPDATVGVCSNESGIDSNRTRTAERYTKLVRQMLQIGRQGLSLLEEKRMQQRFAILVSRRAWS